MNKAVRLTLFLVLAGVVVTGCAPKKKTSKVDALEAQVGVITEELSRLDSQLQELRGATQSGAAVSSSSRVSGGGNVYRTPSGFELPSNNIQAALKNAGYYQGNVDGKIGPATKEALKSFQRDNGLEADGVCGRRTWDKLKPYLAGAK
jgi:peptidoglycan hydrolase-like protein with peptidoglycan-binding domain